jgi:hypothetical protein
VSSLLSLSTFFEHKLQADATRALASLQREDTLLECDEEGSSCCGGPAGCSAPATSASSLCSSDAGDGGCARCGGFGPGSASESSRPPCCRGAGRSGASMSARGADVARVALALSRWGYTVIVRRVLHSKVRLALARAARAGGPALWPRPRAAGRRSQGLKRSGGRAAAGPRSSADPDLLPAEPLTPPPPPHTHQAYWTKSFDNTFIVALDTTSGSGVEYIVDPHFRELFRTGAMSGNYM